MAAAKSTKVSWIKPRLRRTTVSIFIREVLSQATLSELSILRVSILKPAVEPIVTALPKSAGLNSSRLKESLTVS